MGWACEYQADLQNSYKWCSFLNRLTLHWGHHFHQAQKSVSFHVPQEVHCTCAPHDSIPGPVHKMSGFVELYGQLLQLDLNQHPKQRCDNMIDNVQSIIKLVITWFKEKHNNYQWFLHKMTSERPLQKFHTDDVTLSRSEKCIWSVTPKRKFSSVNQKHYLDLGSDTSSVFLQSFPELNLAGKSVVVSWKGGCFLRLYFMP